MRFQELHDALHKSPFEPFRLQLTNGQSHVIRYPDSAWLTRGTVYIGLPSGEDDVPDRAIPCDLLNVVAIEPVDGPKGNGRRKRRKTG